MEILEMKNSINQIISVESIADRLDWVENVIRDWR
jgi:hypothetical protein